MQTTTMPQTIVSMLQSSGRISQAGGMPNVQGAGSDAFAQLIQQLLGQTICAEDQNEDAQQQGTKMAADLFTQLFGNSGFSDSDVLSLCSQIQNPEQLQAIQGDSAQTTLQALMSGMQLTDEQPVSKTAELFQKMTAFHPENSENESEMQVLSMPQTQSNASGETADNLLGGQAEFKNSILAAQKLLNSDGNKTTQKEEPKLVDVEQLQRDVDSGRFSTSLKVDKALSQELDVHNVMTQVKTGIKDNLDLGKNEFVVKLKPEGLGEITVKMLEAESKISLSIVTSSPQVAKLINGELAGLRETLRQYNADVHEVVSQTNAFESAAQNGQFTQQDTTRQFQQFSQQNFQSTQMMSSEEEQLDETILAENVALESELDTYI